MSDCCLASAETLSLQNLSSGSRAPGIGSETYSSEQADSLGTQRTDEPCNLLRTAAS